MTYSKLEQKLKVIFTVPRKIISNNIDLEHCPHCGRYDVLDITCQICKKRHDCFWLMKNDQYSSNKPKALWQKKIALSFAIESISIKLDQWQHRTRCQCHICLWLRDAQMVSLELDDRLKNLP